MVDAGVGVRPRIGVLGYGSILAPKELEDVISSSRSDRFPVRVDGFRRAFNQEATWREVDGDERAVLNVVRDADHWFNAILLADLTREEFCRYRERERGYRLVEVSQADITPYDADDQPKIAELDLVLVAIGEKTRDDIDPLPGYLDICREGARHWGSEFAQDFIDTTETASGEPLRRYREER